MGEVVSGGFQGPFVRPTHGSASDEAARAPEPEGPSGKVSLPAAVMRLVIVRPCPHHADLPRERDGSLLALSPLPIVLLPHIPPEVCHAFPLPNVCARVELCTVLSSPLCLPGAGLKSPKTVDRA